MDTKTKNMAVALVFALIIHVALLLCGYLLTT